MSVEDLWRGARSGTGKRWLVRWRSGGVQHKRRFAVRAAAEAFHVKVHADPDEVAARPSTVTVDDIVATWLATTNHLAQSTRDGYGYDARHILLAFGGRLAASVKPSEVRLWTSRDGGVSQRRRSLMGLRRAYGLAVADRLLKVDPTAGIPLPQLTRTEMRFLTWSELGVLAEMAGIDGPLVWLLGTTGVRLGEALGLDVGDVDVSRRRLKVRRSYSTSTAGTVLGPTKGAKARDVPVSQFVLDLLALGGDGPLFVSPTGVRVNPHNWRERVFKPAARAAGLGAMHPHELRHTAASLAIASGADVKVVQRMLGHASPAITLNVYTGLFEGRLDTVVEHMDRARADELGGTASRRLRLL